MIANPAAAVSGLTNGIADGLGVESSAVEITRTVPDLLGGRRLAEGRRLEATLTVDFDVAVAGSEVSARVDSLTSGDSSVVASLTSEVENGLAAQNFEVTILSVASSAVAATTAAPTAAANGPGAGLSSGDAGDSDAGGSAAGGSTSPAECTKDSEARCMDPVPCCTCCTYAPTIEAAAGIATAGALVAVLQW